MYKTQQQFKSQLNKPKTYRFYDTRFSVRNEYTTYHQMTRCLFVSFKTFLWTSVIMTCHTPAIIIIQLWLLKHIKVQEMFPHKVTSLSNILPPPAWTRNYFKRTNHMFACLLMFFKQLGFIERNEITTLTTVRCGRFRPMDVHYVFICCPHEIVFTHSQWVEAKKYFFGDGNCPARLCFSYLVLFCLE